MSIAVSIRLSLILLLYSLGWSTHFIAAQEANITIPPRAVNASINAVAKFTCTGIGNTFTWNSNGQQLEYGNGTGISIKTKLLQNGVVNIRMSTLRFTVSSTDNATNITCFVVSHSSITTAESHPVLLMVQGLLESVNDLTVVSINSTTVLISWSPPFTLEGVPILGYNVTITNTPTGENETMSVEGDTTMLYYSINYPDPDNNFTVTVVPINGAGPGENVTKRFLFPIDEPMPSVVRTTPLPFTDSVSTTVSTNDIDTTVSVTALGPPTVTPAVSPITPSIPSFTFNDTIIIIGGVIGGLVIITIVVVVAVVVWKRPRLRKYTMTGQQQENAGTTENAAGIPGQASELSRVPQTHGQPTHDVSTTDSNSRIPDDSGIVSDNSMEVTTSFTTSEPVKEVNGES